MTTGEQFLSEPDHEPVDYMSVTKAVSEGVGKVVFSMSPSLLSQMLAMYEIKEIKHTPDEVLKSLCMLAMSDAQEEMIQRAENRDPGSTRMTAESPTEGWKVDSADMGMDMTRRMVPLPEEIDRLCDPRVSAVQFELHLLDEAMGGEQPASTIVLQRTLMP